MALRTTPPGQKTDLPPRALPTAFYGPGNTPPGEDGLTRADELENQAQSSATYPGETDDYTQHGVDFLSIVRTAEQQAQLYTAQVNRRAWTQSLRAFHNEHYIGSKYTRPEWRGRSRLFVPKTRTAVRKDLAAVAASLFNNIDAVSCLPGNDGDPRQRGAAAVMEELVNYRTDRTSGKASFPWFLISCGARMDADLTGICVSKQSWKQEFRKTHEERVRAQGEDGNDVIARREHYALEIDRPDMLLFPSENVVIHPGADWTSPAQSAAYLILKDRMTGSMRSGEAETPGQAWLLVDEVMLALVGQSLGKQEHGSDQASREMGIDRLRRVVKLVPTFRWAGSTRSLINDWPATIVRATGRDEHDPNRPEADAGKSIRRTTPSARWPMATSCSKSHRNFFRCRWLQCW